MFCPEKLKRNDAKHYYQDRDQYRQHRRKGSEPFHTYRGPKK